MRGCRGRRREIRCSRERGRAGRREGEHVVPERESEVCQNDFAEFVGEKAIDFTESARDL